MKLIEEQSSMARSALQAVGLASIYLFAVFSTFGVFADANTAEQTKAQALVSPIRAVQQDLDLDCHGNEACEAIVSLCQGSPFCLALFRICDIAPQACFEEPPECEDFACEEAPFCDVDEGCEEDVSCEDDPESCEDGGFCEEDECDEGTEQRASGYTNPNPLANDMVMSVERAAALQASRFLHQATLGVSYPTITQVASQGEDMWLENQFLEPPGYLRPYTEYLMLQLEFTEDEADEEALFERIGDPEKFHMYAWWTQVMTSPDLVRQRVAMALSEIFVVSSNVEAIGANPFAMAGYYDTLLAHSFGNFRDLLKAVSLNPAMGVYLSHINNAKADPAKGTFPDENYAREVMQLFSIGLFELNPDGTRKMDGDGQFIPTYGQNEIRDFAKIFTGLSFDSDSGFGASIDDLEDNAAYLRPMKMYDAQHSTGEKTLLNGQVVAGGQSGMQDIDVAIDNLFNHPNVGPFIGEQLIKRLVKSNPSPAYIARVTAAFNGNDNAARGDMKAVIRAILLDEEARQHPQQASQFEGRLREPFLRLVRLARAFEAQTSDRTYAATGLEVSATLKQYVLYSPSVFNFFQPDYAPNGEIKDNGLVAPEFQITNASTIIEIKNLVQLWLEDGRLEEPAGQLPTEYVTFETELGLAADPDALLDHLDTLLTYGTLTEATRSVIRTVIEQEDDPEARVRKAIYLLTISPDFAVAI